MENTENFKIPENSYRMRPDIKKRWVEALRSGKFNQGLHRLSQKGLYCCLGVLCELSPVKAVKTDYEELTWDKENQILPPSVRKWSKVIETNPVLFYIKDPKNNPQGFIRAHTLTSLNDEGFTFDQIADLIDYFL